MLFGILKYYGCASELGIAPETSLFLLIAEFIPRKRHQDILTGFAKLNRSEIHLALAGDGLLFKQMQQLAFDLGIQNHVHFLGVRQDIPALIRACVATLLTSQQEGLPRSVMESLCLEIPVIGTDIPGTHDLLARGCGLLVKVGDVDSIAQAMAWVLDHPAEAKMMGKHGQRTDERLWTAADYKIV